MDVELYHALRARKWTREGARFLASRTDDPSFMYHLRKRMRLTPGARPRRQPALLKQHIPHALRKHVFERDAYRCQQCGDWHNLSIDHIVPESAGGTLDPDNLQTLCQSCNSRKGARQ